MRSTRTGTASLSKTLRGACLTGGLTLSLVLAFAASALAVSGTPINIGTPYESGPPSVAVNSSGTAYIAWNNEKDLPPVTTNIVQYCVLPPGATGCSHTGNLAPADSGAYIDGVQVLVDGSTVVILADVYGTAGSQAGDYEPEQEWQSTDGGATFSVVNGGLSVADGILSADTGPLNAVVVPGTNELGYGWNSAGGPPTFNAFPLTSPPECSTQKCDGTPIPDGGPYPFAELEPNTNPDTISNAGGQFAGQDGSTPGVLGIFNTGFSNGPFACMPGSGTAYAYGSGAQSSTNNYNLSPGTANSAWKVAAAQADCNVDEPAVAGGPSGFGVLENDTAHNNIVYHRFDQTNDTFDTPFATIAANQGEQSPAVSQDGSGGIYTTFLLGGGGGPISLAYSSNGGTTWTGPATLNPNTDGGAGKVTSSVGPTGQGWVAWIDNGSVYAQQFVASDAISPVISPPTPTTLTTSQTSGTTTGANISIPAGTVGETDRAILAGVHAATASGTVSYGLYGTSVCNGTALATSTTSVAAGSVGASAPITTALSPGTYYWRAAYSGDAANDAGASSCGSEVLTVTPAATTGGTGTSTSTTVTITITCSGPCTVTVTLTIPTASAARKGKKKPKPLILATGTFTLPNGGTHKLTLHLTKTGRKIFATHHGRLKASLLLSEKIDGHTILSTKTIKITPAKHKHKK
ncbi:MAG: hypothetical protein ACLQRM_02225 [Acidimicrobiales bacterium]|jgi:hypothetical protein